MNSTIHKTLPCSVFGHNYIKSKTNTDNTAQLTCSHCDIIVNTDTKGNFEDYSISNKNINETLRRLYHIKLRSYKPVFS